MFKKLLKYDFKNVGKFGIPILFTLLGITVLGIVNSLLFIKATSSMTESGGLFETMSIISSSFMMMFVFLIIGLASTAIQVAIMVDFYKSLVSDVGYLTFTLPVKQKDILFSKLTSSAVWSLIVGVSCVISSVIIIGTMVAFGGMDTSPTEPIDPIGASGVTALVLGIIFFVVYFINSQLLYFMAIFFASVITRKNKVITAIGCIFGVNFIYGMLSSIASTVIIFSTELLKTESDLYISACIFFAVGIVWLAGLSILFFFATKYMMEKKLNLA